MKNKGIYFSLLFSCLLFASCDKVKFPRQTNNGGGGGGNQTYVRKVLLEDYTGHTCATCPPASTQAVALSNQYGEQLVVISVHAGFLSVPASPPFDYDFRTTEGTAYYTFFGMQATPTGLINRRGYPAGNHLLTYSNWAGNIVAELADPADANIKIHNSYNSGNRQLTSNITAKMLTNQSGLYKLIVLITEDSIVKPQLDGTQTPSTVLNYMHRHVLRGGITPTWGDTAFVGNVLPGDSIVKTYTYTVNNTWNENRCHVVAFIYDDDPLSATYKEVLQVEEEHVK